ncbi:hypothetical protein GQ54DRAFT_199475 [Martensiomyces pterosporus]|nr:hypothetical protein GQ54DRAFT_199475 [Martensiomyces pterosporus]
MSFEFSDEEKKRVIAASLFGINLDHIGYADLGVIIGWSAVHGLQLLALVYALWNRKYPPIRAKGIATMVLMYVAGVMWYVGDIATNEMVHPTNKFLSNCIIVTIWLRSILGQTMMFHVLALRCMSLYFKYKLKRRFKGLARNAASLILIAVPLSAGVIITVLPTARTVSYVRGAQICNFHKQFKETVVILTWIALGTLVLGSIAIHRVPCIFGENREVQIACAALVSVIAFHTTLFYKKPLYPSSLAWRISAVSVDQVAILASWWAAMGVPLYHCLANRDEYLLEWLQREAAGMPVLEGEVQHESGVASELTISKAYARSSKVLTGGELSP